MSLDSMGPATATQENNPRMMIHSLSTPSGVDGSLSSSSHRGGKKLAIRIQMLDDTVTLFQVQAKALAKVLFEQVCRQLNLLEADYFGLEYQEQGSNIRYWLDLEKPLNRQVGLSLFEPALRFCVKFYTPDPSQLEEEFTRFLFCLQVKRDLATGILQCSDNTAAIMASYIVQASCGDYAEEDYPDHTYLSSYRFVPHQDATMQRKIMDNHKKHVGQTPAEADLNLLETARRCELYGMKMHAAKDIEGVPLNLAVAHMGIAVFQGITRINTFSWAKMRKISFKRKRFLVKLHPEGYGYYKDTVDFYFEGRNECKNFWKKCVENHGFFRCAAIQNIPRRKAKVLSRGSSFRYSGKTQKQIIEFVRDNYVKRQTFQRSQSFRQGTLHASSRSQSHNSCNVNSSMSAHPLLPIDNAEWDYRNRDKNSTMHSPMTKSVDSSVHQRDNHTDPIRSHVTAAQVETYPMKNYAMDSHQLVQQQQQPSDNNHRLAADMTQHQIIASSMGLTTISSTITTTTTTPATTAVTSWNSPHHNHNMREVDRGHVPPDGHNLEIYHGINGNVSLNRRGELITNHNGRGDLTLGSDKSSSLSRSEGGVYDVVQAETQLLQNRYNQDGSIQSPTGTSTTTTTNTNYNNNNGHGLTNQFMNDGGGGGVGTTMTNHNQTSISLESNDSEMKKKKWPTDRAYFLAKEILMTERTYKKDLDILNNWFREELSPDDLEKLSTFFNQIDLLIQHHNVFLRDLEHRLLLWEGHGSHDAHRIGDVMLTNMVVLPIYEEYIENYQDILEQLHELFEHDERFQQIFRDFEQQKICYIPIGYLMLKPFYRLLHYQLILEMLLDHYTENHIDRTDCQGALVMLSRLNETVRSVLPDAENYQLLSELQRDLDGFDCLVQNDRKLIRQGCLLKHSKRGLQQRMFFLFSDVLLYGSKSSVNQAFKILGHVPIRSLLTENAEHNTFVIFGGQRAITVSAGTTAEKTLWLAELGRATFEIKNKNHVQLSIGPLKNCSSSEEGLETCGINNNNNNLSSQMTNNVVGTTSKAPPSRSNTALHVCWHRGATVGLTDHLISAENQLSGYLLRKFKNSSGWQKLWVVFTSFCLYFYKNYQDECALASLPLLGYTVGPPGYQDSVQKEYVFKLSFKNHVYFFRAESEHTYNRWLDVLRSTTQTQDFKNITS